MLDNYGRHVGDVVARWARRSNVRLYFTPTSASWLSRIECHFGLLKKFALKKSNHRSHEEQEAAIHSHCFGKTDIVTLQFNLYPKRETVLLETAEAYEAD